MNEREANKILFGSTLKEGPASRDRRLASLPKAGRRSLMELDPTTDEARTSAAIEIQRVWRGTRARCDLYGTAKPGVSKSAVYSGSLHHTTRMEEAFMEDGAPPSTEKMQTAYQEYLQQMEGRGANSMEIMKFEHFSASYLQNWWVEQSRMSQPPPVPPPSVPVPISQPIVPPKPRVILTERQAAAIIQRAWRRHIDIQVYRYYRDLINFKCRGSPMLMLRCINPNEAKLLDAASGVHIKFRLAGERFPPNIYYKIFTHRPIQDLCSNSPKDYTVSTVKLQMTKDVHSNLRNAPDPNDQEGWYKRTENNGWRLVSDRLIHHVMSDSVTWETSKKKYEFKHNKLLRKQDVEKRKKQKKIEWMQKMYKAEMLKAKSDDPETVTLIEGAAAGMVATVEKMGTDALEDWEVDELLDWTTSLNFDEYMNNWKEVATSAFSEKNVEDRIHLYSNGIDPYEFSVSTGPSRYQSTQQSRITPTSSISGGPLPIHS